MAVLPKSTFQRVLLFAVMVGFGACSADPLNPHPLPPDNGATAPSGNADASVGPDGASGDDFNSDDAGGGPIFVGNDASTPAVDAGSMLGSDAASPDGGEPDGGEPDAGDASTDGGELDAAPEAGDAQAVDAETADAETADADAADGT